MLPSVTFYSHLGQPQIFNSLLNLVGSIHRNNFQQLGHIAVFNLGLTPEQLLLLSKIKKLAVYSLEKTNPDILKEFVTTSWGKKSLGWYSWKPVAIKQAFEIFPPESNFLWIDAGTTILQDLSPLFAYIKSQGYFFHNGWDWSIKRQATQFVINALHLNSPQFSWLLNPTVYSIEAGLMGFSPLVFNLVVMPMYELSKDIRFFADDGSAPEGFGFSRNDQTLFSIYVRLNKLAVFDHFQNPKENFFLTIADQQIPFHIASLGNFLTPATSIYCSRHDANKLTQNSSFIHYN